MPKPAFLYFLPEVLRSGMPGISCNIMLSSNHSFFGWLSPDMLVVRSGCISGAYPEAKPRAESRILMAEKKTA